MHRRTPSQLRGPVDFLLLDCNYPNYYLCCAGIEAQLAGGAVVVADNVGIGTACASDYLGPASYRYRAAISGSGTGL